ncbi:unnamed protein product [Euphydryas editha]|uniref:Integrase catalytic domain-containing protein n=2 Tax=Euphydryas editha TaxID=104508 RepID=A0AAU9VCU6_EUPED|nr:unnamed protein product [Euphydryas editha]
MADIKTQIGIITELSNKIIKLLTNTKKCSRSKITKGYLDTRLELLNEYRDSYNKQYHYFQTKYSDKELKGCEFDYENNYNITEDAYLDLKTFIKDYLYEIDSTHTSNKDIKDTPDLLKLKPKLPPIPIPFFNGDYHKWISFRDLYLSLIHNNNNLTNIEKHHYLKASLTGEAEQLLQNFSLSDANYQDAWKKLVDRFDNQRVIVNNILNRLLNQKKLTMESTQGIKDLLDTTTQCLDSLKNIGIDVSNWDAIIVHITVRKLDTESHKLWEQSLENSTDIPTFQQLTLFLEKRFRSMEMIYTTHNKDYVRKPMPQKVTNVKSFATEMKNACTYCSQNHYICHCKDFASLKVSERQEFIKRNNICFNCLIKGHNVLNCRQSTTCKKCGRRHHTLLHYTPLSKTDLLNSNSSSSIEENKENPASSCNTVCMKTESQSHQVILATAQLAVEARKGNTYILRALIDQGSQASFMTEAAAQLLQLDRIPVNGKVTGVSNSTVVTIKSMVKFKIQATRQHTQPMEVKAYVLKKLTSLLPSREFTQDAWPSTMSLDLADPEYYKPRHIDILLGADVHAEIIQEGIHKHKSLVAVNSCLGWLISGRVSQIEPQKHDVIVTHTKVDVDQLLRQFWEIEEPLSHKKPLTELEVLCEEHFKKTHTRTDEGRYVVRLPFRETPPTELGDTKLVALRRLQQMEKRFTQSYDLKEKYTKFMDEYLTNGHMEPIPERELKPKNQCYYLPHHAVVRPENISTKLRVVFDGSATPDNGKSLNEELLIGPSILQDIRNLITRWRQHKICLIGDIMKMYRQILISKEDRDYQRILWRKSPKDPVKEYRLLTVTYGTSSAPFLAMRTLHQLADDEAVNFPQESAIIKSDIYMDDLMTGASTEEDAIRLQSGLTELLNRGGFKLHKWSSNSESVLSKIPNDDRESQSVVHIKVQGAIKALGIVWNSQTDNFELKLNLDCDTKLITKRNVLSAIAKTFDPLGWLAPAIISLKIFMQKLWLAGLDWDEELTPELKAEWLTYIDNFANAPTIEFPRWLFISNLMSEIELHGFCDASCVAYASVVYLRVRDGDKVNVRLIAAKSRVAPVKQVSLPRLELCGAVLLARMLRLLISELNINKSNVYAWTDSTIVLAWLRKTPNNWSTFVANRTAEILTCTNSSQWHHIFSICNPADIASRGINPIELQQSELWWNGPKFLKQPTVMENYSHIPETNLELKTKVLTHLCLNESFTDSYLNKFSNLSKLVRVTAYCQRFIQNCKLNKGERNISSFLTATELKNSLNFCIKLSQHKYFEIEIDCLSQGKCVPKKSKLYTLNPYLDKDQIVRVGGRLRHAEIPPYQKSPIVLSYNCQLSKLITIDAHIRTLHGGHQLTLNYIRQKYWIFRVKNLTKTVIKKCIPCFKQCAVPHFPFMGNLPHYRVRPDRPFRTTGTDFAGPFSLKLYPGRCKKICKAYICLFVCTVTKAIHLEVVSDLTSSAFIAAFKRFTARRGHCKDMWSDCGTNFIGASRELDVVFKNAKSHVVSEISELLANDQTNWHFIPPHSPHFGGLWESGVKSVKTHLKRVIGQTSLTFEEFYTLLTQIESCVNSRPLTLINSSLDEPPLTPGHFLIGEPPLIVPDEPLENVKLSPLQRWRMLQQMMQHFWHRWQDEYLVSLQNRSKWNRDCPDIKIGTIVLVKDDRLPPGKWLLGRVVDKHPGIDGITRVVTLQNKTKKFKRPIVKLCPLPLDA